jgi:multiple sugar transport system permease protein
VLKRQLSSRREAYLFASPALFLIVAFAVLPLFYAFYLTFQNYDLAIGPPAEFVGLENYTEMLDDTRFWRSWLNTFLLSFRR